MSATPSRVLGLGELLWDLLPDGRRLGGAPFNVIANLARLGHDARFVTAVGEDDLGRAAVAEVKRLGVDAGWIARTSVPTGTVDVILDPAGGPSFRIVSPAAYETIDLSPDAVAAIAAWPPDALVFGTVAQRVATVLASTRVVIQAAPIPLRLYDVNLRDSAWSDDLVLELLSLATIVKTNADEAAVLGRLLTVDPEPTSLGDALAERFGVRGLCVTRGGEGASLWLDGSSLEVAPIEVDVVDTVGAGDAFAAGLLDGLLRDRPPAECLERANRLGALVASKSGALPDWSPDELDGSR